MNPFATIDDIRARTTEAIIGQSGLNHTGLNAEIRRRFGSADWREGGVMQEPVLEAALPYVTATETLDDLAGDLLEPSLVEALDGSDTPHRPYPFLRTQKPYAHQLEAWRLLSDPATARSVLVTSGTGSGKTECFVVPILNDLARQSAASPHRLEGVQAIMLYPLNALIASQEERLRAWTEPFQGKIRFALYNGILPSQVKAGEGAARPETVADRKLLRAAPPPILVTNVTMLEYMLLRPEDAPILAKSQGKLRYVVLDEAHSYVGAQAAEIALLLRRVCLAFGVDPTEVRFIATSATIGTGEHVERSLHRFLTDVSGAPSENVHVIQGRQRTPELPPLHAGGPIQDETHFTDLGGHPAIRPLLEQLYAGPTPWSAVREIADGLGVDPAVLALKLAHARSDTEGSLAPLRVHSFHRAAPGLWSCLNPACSLPRPTDWAFGAIHHQPGDVCGCGAPLFEVVSCSTCGEAFLDVEETPGQRLVQPKRGGSVDEFAMDADSDAPEADDDQVEAVDQAAGDRKLIALKPHAKSVQYHWLCVEAATGAVHDRGGVPGVLKLAAYDRNQPDTCPACATTARQGSDLIRPLRFGAPFILGNATPILLEGAAYPDEATDPAHWIEGAPPPMRGHQLLSFTDSRQGTARLSAKLQTASERNHVRSVVFHAVQDVLNRAADPTETKDLDKKIAALRPAFESTRDPTIGGMLAGFEADLAKLARKGEAGLPWDEMVDQLAARAEVKVWIRSVWSRRAIRFEKERQVAEFLLLREFVRRPPRANSPETLGLARLRFNAIDRIPDAMVPNAFTALGGSAQDWRDYLHLLVTFAIRGRSAIRVQQDLLQWIPPAGARTKELVSNTRGPLARWELAWPNFGNRPVGRPPMIVTLLEQACGRSLDDAALREQFQDVFTAAWAALGELTGTPGTTNRQLSFSAAHVAPVTTAWFCPVTRRLLDVSFQGLSPYGAKTRGAAPVQAIRLDMPRHPLPFAGLAQGLPPQEGVGIIKDWLATDPSVADLRARGAWGDISDRLALFSDYFRSAEHSAQQQPRRLRRYEREFKAGAINVLNCSTTMEMGVDIGSVSHVMMTNLPPSIANYRQRVGRAGRRGQPLSMAFTFCKDRPLDREAFREPAKFLTRGVRSPQVALRSRVIVQRHVNAQLFAGYIHERGGDAMKMHAGPFFGCNAAIGAAEEPDNFATRMSDWMRRPETCTTIGSAIARLTSGTVLAGDGGVYDAAATALDQAREAYAAEWRATQLVAAGAGEDQAAQRRLSMHLRRLCEDYLLGVLASRGFLPGHGFPTDVVSFVIRTDKLDAAGPEENSRFSSYPQRSLDSAIREYAPGSEVVLDGLVHKSAGVTLNWKRPASADGVREVQALMWRWRCSGCGESGTVRQRDFAQTDCPSCNAAHAHWFEYLQPAGFAVDLREDPHADADVVTYVAPEPTAVSASGGNWLSLFDPGMGRRRSAREGSVFYCNAGPSRNGYAICLSCGRAGVTAGEAHTPLLGYGSECEGSLRSFAQKDGLRLGHEIHTDVFELQPAGWNEPGGAVALGVALREALARMLGVEPDEMGVSAEPRRDLLGGATISVFLHDKATGGAGFSIQAEELFADMVRDAEQILDCQAPGCVRGCPACVLVGDLSEEQVRDLNRGVALALVRERLLSDGAPAECDQAGPDARFSSDTLAEINQALEGGARQATLYVSGALDAAQLEAWSAAELARTWSQRGRRIVLALDTGVVDALDDSQKLNLRDLANRWGVELAEGKSTVFNNGARMLAEATDEVGHATVFASRDEAALDGGSGWGRAVIAPVVRFKRPGPAWSGSQIDESRLRPSPGAKLKHITTELDGPLSGFGKRCAGLLQRMIREVGVPDDMRVARFEYEDRYLVTPLALRLCLDTLFHLRAGETCMVPLLIRTAQPAPSDRASLSIDSNWKRDDDRAVVARMLARARLLNLEWRLGGAGHARRLTVEFEAGPRMQILFDQGFGAWTCDRGAAFDFHVSPSDQTAKLQRIEARVQIRPRARTYLVAEVSPPTETMVG